MTSRIAGVSVLKGIVLYGAVLTFAGFYVYFIVKISGAGKTAPHFDSVMVGAAAALAGVLGSAFAVVLGVPTDASATNSALKAALVDADRSRSRSKEVRAKIQRFFSLEPSGTDTASWPQTFGIWVYAIVAGAVAVTYFLNQQQTPDRIKVLAITFAGYVLALITAAYGITSKAK